MARRYTAKMIGVRLRPQDREPIVQAAALAGEQLAEFARRATLSRARRVLKDAQAQTASPEADSRFDPGNRVG